MTNPAPRRVPAIVRIGHGEQCAVEVPFDPGLEWGLVHGPVFPGRKGYLVSASLGGAWFDGFVVPRMKRWWLLVDRAALDAAGIDVGEDADVRVRPRA